MDNFILAKTFHHYGAMRAAAEGQTVMPVSCEVDVSNLCNLDCSFCMFSKFRSKVRDMLDWQTYTSLIYQLKEVGCRSITFTGGGEPLLHPDFNQMADFAYYLGLDIGLITNGTRLNSLSNPAIFKFIRVSLDAASPEVYHRVKGRNKFDQVIQGIQQITQDKKVFVGLSYVVCEENCADIKEAQKVADGLNVKYIQFKPAYIRKGKSYEDYKIPKHIRSITTERFIATDDLPCRLAGLVGIVTADANVCFCCQYRGKFIAGNLRTKKFKDLWNLRYKMQPNIKECPPCRYMAYANAYKAFKDRQQNLFWKHRDFL